MPRMARRVWLLSILALVGQFNRIHCCLLEASAAYTGAIQLCAALRPAPRTSSCPRCHYVLSTCH